MTDLGGGHMRQEDVEVSPTQSRISPSRQRILKMVLMVPRLAMSVFFQSDPVYYNHMSTSNDVITLSQIYR